MFVIMAFLFVLCGIVCGVVVIEKTASRHMSIAERIIEDANETY